MSHSVVRSQPTAADAAASLTRALGTCLAAPFDALRLAHGCAVQCGLAPRSMLASREFERALAALEGLALGPLARRA
jgi:hypothetical protein